MRSATFTIADSTRAAERLREMTPPGHRAVIHVTLTDDHPWAQAFVVIEALPLDGDNPVALTYPPRSRM